MHQATPQNQFKRFGLVIAILILALAGWLDRSSADLAPGQWQVTQVVDGDTIRIKSGRQTDIVRLIGVDTPESQHPDKPVQCFSNEATQILTKLIGKQPVTLTADHRQSDRDKYGRQLRYAYTDSGQLINSSLIAEGAGFAYTVFKFDRQDEFIQVEAQAKNAKVGLWGKCQVDESQRVKQTL